MTGASPEQAAGEAEGCVPLVASLSPGGATMLQGKSLVFAARVVCAGFDVTGEPATNISWSVTGGIGTMSQPSGTGSTLTANAVGTGQVVAYATYYQLVAEARAEVEVFSGGKSCNILSTWLSPSQALLNVGQKQQFRATIDCDQTNVTGSSQITWSATGGIGSVSPQSGAVTDFTAAAAGPGQVVASLHYGNMNGVGGANVVVTTGNSGGGPYVTGTVPTDLATGVLVDRNIEISFSTEMNATSSQSAVSSTPAISGAFSWPTPSLLVWNPNANLQASTVYQVTISTAAKSTTWVNLVRAHTFNFTTATGGGGTAPVVTSTGPVNGATGVPVNANIDITFNVPMNRSATESAVSASPAITGAFTWDGGDTVLSWNPSTDLQAATKYTVTVSTLARSQAGVNMNSPVSFSFTTAGGSAAPMVTATGPANGSFGWRLGTKINLLFNVPMDTVATEAAISALPPVSGAFTWSGGDTNATWDPAADLQPATKYFVTVSTAAKSKDGVNMVERYRFEFTTAWRPMVVSTVPADSQTGVFVGVTFVLGFNLDMSRAETEAAFSVAPAAPGVIGWTVSDTVLTYDPSPDLLPGTMYTVKIGAGAKSAKGVTMLADHTFSFTTAPGDQPTPPGVLATSPPGGATDVPQAANVVIEFNKAMDRAATEAALASVPSAPGALSWSMGDTVLSLDPAADLAPGKKYGFTIASTARSAQGVALPEVYAFSFTTVTLPDQSPPVIVHTPPQPVTEGTPLDIVAQVTDDVWVDAVNLYYRQSGQILFKSVPMPKAASGADDYAATIPAEDVKPTSVEYYIEATDQAGKKAWSPSAAPGTVHSVAVTAKGATGIDKLFGTLGVPLPIIALLVLLVVAAAVLLMMRRRRKRSPAEPMPDPFGGEVVVATAVPAAPVPQTNQRAPIEAAPSERASAASPAVAASPMATASASVPKGVKGEVERDETDGPPGRKEMLEKVRAKRAGSLPKPPPPPSWSGKN